MKQRTAKQIVHVPVTHIPEQSAVTVLLKPQTSITAVEASQVVGSLPLSEDFAAPVNNQVHQEQIVATMQAQFTVQEIPEVLALEKIQIVETGVNRDTTGLVVQEIPEVSVVERIQEQIVETIEVIPQERVQPPTMQVVTREQFHSDVKHTPRREVRFATEDDVQFIAASSRRAQISENTRALAEFTNDSAQLECDGFVVPSFNQQCDDLEARIAVFSREQSSSSSPSSPKKLRLSRSPSPSTEAPTVEFHTHTVASGRALGISQPSLCCQPDARGSAYSGGRSSKTPGKTIHIAAKQSVDAPRGTDFRVTHGVDPYRREGETRERKAAFIYVTDGTRLLLYVPLTRSRRGFTNDHYCGENREHKAAYFLYLVEDDDHDSLWLAC